MSALDGFVRLSRWQVEERRRQLAGLESLAARLAEAAAGLRQEQLSGPPDRDANGLIERRARLEQSQAEVAQQILLARDALGEATREAKRHEAAAAARTARLRPRAPGPASEIVRIERFRRSAARR